jgi:hypothetical protein
MCPET